MTKRGFLGVGLGGAAATAIWRLLDVTHATAAQSATFEVVKTPEQWRQILTSQQFAVLRQEATERPFSSPLDDEQRDGVFHCAGCDQMVFESSAKYDSGTGWPSFWRAIEGKTATRTDYKLFIARTEEHCSRCGGHLGHVFNDGPEPTGKRHCMNGVAMVFRPSDGSAPVYG